MKKFSRKALGCALTLALSSTVVLQAQEASSFSHQAISTSGNKMSMRSKEAPSEATRGSGTFLTLRPFTFILGPNIGFEQALSNKWSISGEVTSNLWLVSTPTIALRTHMKYYLLGRVGKGLYGRLTATGGHFWAESAVDGRPYYAGGGIGIGGMVPLSRKEKWHISIDGGLKFVPLFGKKGATMQEPQATNHLAYYSLFSPGSLIDLSIGIAYRF